MRTGACFALGGLDDLVFLLDVRRMIRIYENVTPPVVAVCS